MNLITNVNNKLVIIAQPTIPYSSNKEISESDSEDKSMVDQMNPITNVNDK